MSSEPVGVIAAVSPDGVIGRDNRIPWHRSADLKRFKRQTVGGTVIMGRKTFESIGRPLPRRTNVVVTRSSLQNVLTASSLEKALALGDGPIWIIGGARLFEEALCGPASFVDLTHVPDPVPTEGAVFFPSLDPERWVAGHLLQNAEDPELWHQRFSRL